MFSVSLKNYTNPVVAGGRGFYGWVPCQTGNQRRTKFVELSKYDQIGSLHPALVPGWLGSDLGHLTQLAAN